MVSLKNLKLPTNSLVIQLISTYRVAVRNSYLLTTPEMRRWKDREELEESQPEFSHLTFINLKTFCSRNHY